MSLNLQVPNTWLWWIWTCDWELCFAQKVAGEKIIATEHEIHLSDAWHSNRWWNSHFMLQTCCTFSSLAFIGLSGCLSVARLCVYVSLYALDLQIQILESFFFCVVYRWKQISAMLTFLVSRPFVACQDVHVPEREVWSSHQTRMTKMSKSLSKRFFFLPPRFVFFSPCCHVFFFCFVSKIKTREHCGNASCFCARGHYTWRPLS